MKGSPWLRGLLLITMAVPAFGQERVARVELIPPSPVTDKIILDIRGAVENNSDRSWRYTISLYLDQEIPAARLDSEEVLIPAHGNAGIYCRRPTAGWAGTHRVILVAESPIGRVRAVREVEILPSAVRSTRMIGGAWVDIVHWSDAEARYYNADLQKLTEEDWQQQIQGMHAIGMNTVVVQEVFRNQAYYGKNTIATTGYHGKAFYPSALFQGRVAIASHDPLEAILSEADRLHMYVFLGVGNYAWFDYSAASLEWHEKVAAELWHRYGHHPSLYGWYLSEEVDGSLMPSLTDGTDGVLVPNNSSQATERYRREIITFFTEFQAFCRKLAPEKPVMLAPNAFHLRESEEAWVHLMRHVDIVCPFGFARMPKGDLTDKQAAELWQRIADQADAHLWLDMEAFVFEGGALVPRPIDGLAQDLNRYPNFEKTLCYEYTGLFNSPQSKIKPGGPPTVVLYRGYQQYLWNKSQGHLTKAGSDAVEPQQK